MSRCIAVGCWRRTVGISRWCREHTDMILDLPAAEWPMSRREAKVREQLRRTVGISRWCREHTDMILDLPAAEWPMSRREAKVREQLRRAHWEPTTPPPTIQRGPVGPQAPGGAA